MGGLIAWFLNDFTHKNNQPEISMPGRSQDLMFCVPVYYLIKHKYYKHFNMLVSNKLKYCCYYCLNADERETRCLI